jgi:hypothetical protein
MATYGSTWAKRTIILPYTIGPPVGHVIERLALHNMLPVKMPQALMAQAGDRQDLDWVGVNHKAGSRFRLMMDAFHAVTPNDKLSCVRVYSIHYPACTPY